MNAARCIALPLAAALHAALGLALHHALDRFEPRPEPAPILALLWESTSPDLPIPPVPPADLAPPIEITPPRESDRPPPTPRPLPPRAPLPALAIEPDRTLATLATTVSAVRHHLDTRATPIARSVADVLAETARTLDILSNAASAAQDRAARLSAQARATQALAQPSPAPGPSSPANDGGTSTPAPATSTTGTDSLASGPIPRGANAPPAYPPQAARDRVQGTVTLTVLVAADGRATSARVRDTSGSPLLDAAAIDAVLRWHFHPAMDDHGRPVECEASIPIQFRLKASP